jgi:hypothetical protein
MDTNVTKTILTKISTTIDGSGKGKQGLFFEHVHENQRGDLKTNLVLQSLSPQTTYK